MRFALVLVAVLNGAGEPGREAVLRLRTAAAHGGHDAVGGEVAIALESVAVPSPDRGRGLVETARRDLVRFDYDAVLGRLRDAEEGAEPDEAAVRTLAELNLLAGIAYAGRKDEARAVESFRLVRRLAPALTALDRAVYQPRLVRLYDEAGRPPPGPPATLRATVVPPDAALWVDGRVTTSVELPAGDHYVGALADGHAGRLVRVRARAGAAVAPEVRLAALAPAEDARRLRDALLAGEDAARVAARVAALTGAAVVVILRHSDGAVEAATWRRGSLAAFAPLASVEAVLAARPAPPRAVSDPPPPAGPTAPPPDEPRRGFWTSGWGIATIAAGAAVVVATAVWLIAGRGDDTYRVGPPCFSGSPDCP